MILYFKFLPPLVCFELFCTKGGGNSTYKLSFSYITENWLKLELSFKNHIFYPIIKLYKSGRRSLQLQSWLIYKHLFFKIQRGVAPSILEPRCILNIFKWYLYHFLLAILLLELQKISWAFLPRLQCFLDTLMSVCYNIWLVKNYWNIDNKICQYFTV